MFELKPFLYGHKKRFFFSLVFSALQPATAQIMPHQSTTPVTYVIGFMMIIWLAERSTERKRSIDSYGGDFIRTKNTDESLRVNGL